MAYYSAGMFMPHATPVVRALTSAQTMPSTAQTIPDPTPHVSSYQAPQIDWGTPSVTRAAANATQAAPATAAASAAAASPAHQASYQAILAALNKMPLSWGKPGTATGAGAYTAPTYWVHSDPEDEASAYKPYVPTPITAGMSRRQANAIKGEGPRVNNRYTYAAAPAGSTWGAGRMTMGDSGTTKPFTPEQLAHAEAAGYVPVGTPFSQVEYSPGGGGAENWSVMPQQAYGGGYDARMPIFGQGLGTDMMPIIGYANNPWLKPFTV
jgi:hypothetical protein